MAARQDAGFTLAELLVASALTLVVAGAVFAFIASHVTMAQAQPDAADVQQRARAAADALAGDLHTAGAAGDRGGTDVGFACCLPVVQPRRVGARSADPPGTARTDAITIVRMGPGAAPVRLRDALVGNRLTLEDDPACPAVPLCGLSERDAAVIFDDEGRHDFVTIGVPEGNSAPVTARQPGAPHAFASGASAAAVDTRTYYFDALARQLRQYDGNASDVPVIDDVVAVRFEYWGDAGAPARARRPDGVVSCWFDAAGLPRFGAVVAAAGAPLVRLPVEELRDGPWCGAGDNRFDADLLRIRRVRVVVRVSAASDAARGAAGDLFVRAGRATNAQRLVPDVEVAVDVAPRNLNGDR